MTLNPNTDLAFINTNSNSGIITLPASATSQGRVITFKDIQGTFNTNTLTLQCDGSDTFEDGGTSKVLRESYGSIQIVASGTKWYILNGTQVNTLQVSSLNVLAISSLNISTINATISTLKFIDNRFSTNQLNVSSAFLSTQNVSTNLLYYNNYVIAGTRVGYSNVLNRYRFSPQQVPGLALWLDAADSNTVLTSGGFVTQWNDKSGLNRNVTAAAADCTYGSSIVNGLNAIIMPQATTTNGFLSPTFVLAPNNKVSTFLVFQTNTHTGSIGSDSIMISSSALANDYQIFFRAQSAPPTTFPITLYGRLNGVLIGGANVSPGFPFMYLYEQIFDSLINTLYINGSVSGNPFASVTNNVITAPRSFRLFYNYVQGYACEVIIVNDAVNNTNKFILEGYLAWKWGFQASLPASHPYKNAPPT